MSRRRSFYVMCLLGLLAVLGVACAGETNIKPLPDPVFRLKTDMTPTGCDPKQGKEACKWEIIGVVNSAVVVDQGDNPFQDCSACVFSQKITVTDGDGGLHQFYYRLPTDEAIFVRVGAAMRINYTAAARSGEGYAVSLRDEKGQLIAAFSSGAGGNLLEGMLGEFEVIVDLEKEAGRQSVDCGTQVFRYIVFRTSGGSVELVPGKTGQVVDSNDQSFRVGHVNRFNWEGLRCPNLGATPFAYFIFRSPT